MKIRETGERRQWTLGLLPYGLSTFDYFMNTWSDTLAALKPFLYIPFRVVICVILDNKVIGFNDQSSDSGKKGPQIIYNNNCY